MKKVLMGTTALVAAAGTTGVAADEMAAEPISLTVGGNSQWGVAIVDNELDTAAANGEADDLAISNDVELRFAGSTVLDSGVEVGVRIEIEGEESSDQGDETYMYIEGSFGTIRVGNDDPASYSMATAAPYATYFYGINTPYWVGSFSGPNSNWHSTFPDGAAGNDDASIMYFSPVINGFQFGVSYAPEAGAEARSATASRAKDHDLYAIGARYDGSFGDAGVTIAGGYASKDVPAQTAVTGSYLNAAGEVAQGPTDSISPGNILRKSRSQADGRTVKDWAMGVVVSMSGVSVGRSYRNTDHDVMGADDVVQYDIGVSYGEGPWVVSVNYGAMTQDKDGSTPNVKTDNGYTRLIANYNLGPGINLAGVIGEDSYEVGTTKGDTTFAGIAMGISF